MGNSVPGRAAIVWVPRRARCLPSRELDHLLFHHLNLPWDERERGLFRFCPRVVIVKDGLFPASQFRCSLLRMLNCAFENLSLLWNLQVTSCV